MTAVGTFIKSRVLGRRKMVGGEKLMCYELRVRETPEDMVWTGSKPSIHTCVEETISTPSIPRPPPPDGIDEPGVDIEVW